MAAVFCACRQYSSFFVGYGYNRSLQRRARQLLQAERFDLIWVHCSSVAHYVLDRGNGFRVMDFDESIPKKWFEYPRQRRSRGPSYTNWKGSNSGARETAGSLSFDRCTVVSRAEKRTLDTFDLPLSVKLIPNGVDLEYFNRLQANEYDPNTIIFLD